MSKIIVVVLLCFSSINLMAQFSPEKQKEIDSLYHEIKTSKFDTTIANAYVVLSESLYTISVDTLIPLCENAQKICIKNLKKDNLTPNEIYSFKSSLAAATNNIGFVYGYRGDAILEREYYLKSLKLKEEINDQKGVAITLNNIGGLATKSRTFF
jgi:hypothetical protein